MSKPSILLVGAGGHARACVDVIEREGRFVIAGLVGTAAEVGTRIFGYSVIGSDLDLPALRGKHEYALVSVGQIKTPAPRIRLWDLLTQGGWQLPTIVSPFACVSPHGTLGAGTIVMHGAVLNAGAAVGRNCIINTRALVEHDAVIGDHCHIATAAAINGGVRIGTSSFVGSGTIVREGVTIGDNVVIGMGQRVLADCPTGMSIPGPKQVA